MKKHVQTYCEVTHLARAAAYLESVYQCKPRTAGHLVSLAIAYLASCYPENMNEEAAVQYINNAGWKMDFSKEYKNAYEQYIKPPAEPTPTINDSQLANLFNKAMEGEEQ